MKPIDWELRIMQPSGMPDLKITAPRSEEGLPGLSPRGLWPKDSPRREWAKEGGFSVVELLVAMGILALLSGLFFTVLVQMGALAERESSKSTMVSTARGGVELVTRTLRNEMIQFNTVGGTPLGINFDLDDAGQPLVRDAILFYIDRNRTALLYPFDTSGEPFSAGLDDVDGDGFADLLGIGLLRQDDNGDGVQDFIDADTDGAADDLDGDGNPDPLWRLVSASFSTVADVGDAVLWRTGFVLARNLYVRRLAPAGALVASNIDTFQFVAKSPTALASDANGDGVLDETELGNLTSADGVINALLEVSTVDAVLVNLHIADLARFGNRRSLVRQDVSTSIAPRSLVFYRRNGVVNYADATDPRHIN